MKKRKTLFIVVSVMALSLSGLNIQIGCVHFYINSVFDILNK